MKMLCIRGKQNPWWHTGLKAGAVYEVTIGTQHCGEKKVALAEGSVFKRHVRLRCNYCGAGVPSSFHWNMVPWDPRRFVPWQPDEDASNAHEAKQRRALARKRGKEDERVSERA